MRYHPKSLFKVRNAIELAAILVAGSLLSGCGADSRHATMSQSSSATAAVESSAAPQINVDNFTFSPQTLTVPVGATITWINNDDVPHTVVDVDKRFKSAALDTDDKFSFTFTTAGEYSYFCGIHPHMTGKIIVK
jgi:plastocyanin